MDRKKWIKEKFYFLGHHIAMINDRYGVNVSLTGLFRFYSNIYTCRRIKYVSLCTYIVIMLRFKNVVPLYPRYEIV